MNNPLFEPISTSDIILKLLITKDARDLFNLTDSNKDYLREWLPWLDKTTRVEDSQKFINNSYKDAKLQKAAHFGIFFQSKLVGAIGFHVIDKENRLTTIGYWLAEGYQGKGIMTKSVEMVINLAFSRLDLNRVQINCAVGNKKSSAIPKKLGFTLEGTIRDGEWLYDHFVDIEQYGLLSRDSV